MLHYEVQHSLLVSDDQATLMGLKCVHDFRESLTVLSVGWGTVKVLIPYCLYQVSESRLLSIMTGTRQMLYVSSCNLPFLFYNISIPVSLKT
jgi:hypothetical protein